MPAHVISDPTTTPWPPRPDPPPPPERACACSRTRGPTGFPVQPACGSSCATLWRSEPAAAVTCPPASSVSVSASVEHARAIPARPRIAAETTPEPRTAPGHQRPTNDYARVHRSGIIVPGLAGTWVPTICRQQSALVGPSASPRVHDDSPGLTLQVYSGWLAEAQAVPETQPHPHRGLLPLAAVQTVRIAHLQAGAAPARVLRCPRWPARDQRTCRSPRSWCSTGACWAPLCDALYGQGRRTLL